MFFFALLVLASTLASKYKYNKPRTNSADMNSRQGDINKMLLEAVWDGNDKHVKELIDLGAEVNAFTSTIWRMTPIYYAASLNRMSTMQILLDAEYADMDFPDSYENTPLHIAAAKGYTEIASLLVEVGANLRLKDSFGDTPLHNASAKGHADIAALLVKNFPTGINLGNNEGNTPLHLANANGHDNIASLLVEFGADGNLKNNDGKTANDLNEKQAKKSAPAKLVDFTLHPEGTCKYAHDESVPYNYLIPGQLSIEQCAARCRVGGVLYTCKGFSYFPNEDVTQCCLLHFEAEDINPPDLKRVHEDVKNGLCYIRSNPFAIIMKF